MNQYEAFWRDLSCLIPDLGTLLNGAADSGAIDKTSAVVRGLDPDLRWEIGPHLKGAFFALSPNGLEEKLPLVRAVISEAPHINGWTFFPGKPERKFSGTVDLYLGGSHHKVSVTEWQFVLMKHKSGKPYDVLFYPNIDCKFDKKVRNTAAILLVDAAIGERMALELISDVVVVETTDSEYSLRKTASPVSQLREVFVSQGAFQ